MPTCTAGYTALSSGMLTAWKHPCSFNLQLCLWTTQLQLAQARQQPASPGNAGSNARDLQIQMAQCSLVIQLSGKVMRPTRCSAGQEAVLRSLSDQCFEGKAR